MKKVRAHLMALNTIARRARSIPTTQHSSMASEGVSCK